MVNLLTHLCSSQHGLAEIDGTSGFEVKLKSGLANKVAIGLGANFAFDIIGTENRLLQFNLIV